MTDEIVHRGPDDGGVWVDAQTGVALGHRRLSILDLSPQGHQPMISLSGRYVIAFNGEVYNHQELRKELECPISDPNSKMEKGGVIWRGHSDTEVMLAAFERWGLEGALSRFNGMFAFALWDRQDRVLHLARDRFGEKPLYYGWMGDTFLFGSELKAMKAHPAWQGEIDRGALALYMRHTYISAPYSIYSGIRKLLPAHILSIPLSAGNMQTPPSRAYWSVKAVAEAGVRHPFAGNEAEAVESLDGLLRDAVKLRMEADVPLGAFLSGGIDSSAVVALMQAQSLRPVKTFTIGFHEEGYNEAKHAKAVAKHLGTEHTELYVTAAEAMAVIPKLPKIYDEPFADSSQIPTFLVSKMTRQHVTVALSGDGGDELFGGYNRYFWGRDIWRKVGWMPKSARVAMARGLTALPPQSWDKIFSAMETMLPRRLRANLPGDKLHKLAGVLACSSPEAMYRGLVSFWEPESVVLGASEPPTALTDRGQWADIPDFTQRMMFLDTVSYLPDDILAKVDRASMAVSLEGRVPLLDHRVAEFAWTLPLDMKIRGGQGKWPLRQLLYKYVPRELIERPKMGFGVPIDVWLRGPLREWAENLLDESRLKREGFFNTRTVREKWSEHLAGNRNWASLIWTVLMFQAWLEENK
jgi:asparagine synthase (glutamine-hydrolysing)